MSFFRPLPGASEVELKLHLVPPPLDNDILDAEANTDPVARFDAARLPCWPRAKALG
ncbi:hypothetical protein [Phyllobacterium brassicacearum]|uniref:hypothetical protein n=1 Tax=Phyllobacterium brassicacearum TaxID=314235 RepID=UPI001414E813|nr:hypothetical protein [Phyllobacterium brassicacearum]